MADLETLKALRERVLKAEGADRELDGLLAVSFWQMPEEATFNGSEWQAGDSEHPIYYDPPFWSRSIDAALALVERCLPGCNGSICFGEPHRNPFVNLAPLREDGRHSTTGPGATIPLAILAALLACLIQQEEANAAA